MNLQQYKDAGGSFSICPDVGKCGCTCIVLRSHSCVPVSVVQIQLSRELQGILEREKVSGAFGVIFPFCFYLSVMVSKQVSLLNTQLHSICYFFYSNASKSNLKKSDISGCHNESPLA